MSEIDKRVVQMVFDNEDFEKNIAKSKKSLESMDDSLDNIEKSVSKRGLEKSISESIEKSEIKIQAFKSMIDTVVSSITSTILGAFSGIQRAANHLTFDQAIAGFEKYTSQLESVQTITNAVQYKFQDLATAVGYVEEELDKLNWFTDQTSYNFSDMASNIGKFTAVGVDLEEASSAMQGIANWAGLAGQNAASASRAMYNLAQAMSAGKVQLIDWKSIQNANMDTQEFRKIVYNVAKARADAGEQLGGLDAEWFKNNDANAFFSDLKKGGFTKDVLMDTLQIFSAYSDEVHRMVEAENISVDKAMEKLDKVTQDQYKNLKRIYDSAGEASDEFKKKSEELGLSIETAVNIAKLGGKDADLGWQYFDVAKRAFHAAQEYKTFKDVVDATADAVSTAWMRIYKTIFGNYLEAKEFWTELGGIFDDVFGGPVYAIEDIVKTWRDFSGREFLIGIAEDGEQVTSVFQNLVEIISTIGETIGQAFLETNKFFAMFSEEEGETDKYVLNLEKLGQALAYYTLKLREFVANLKESVLAEDNLEKIQKTARGFFVIIKNIGKVFYSVFRSVGVILKALFPSFDTLIGLMNSAEENTKLIDEKVNKFANTIYKVANVIAAIIKGFKQSVMDGTVIEYLTNLGVFLVNFAFTYIRKFISNVETESIGFKDVMTGIGNMVLAIAASIVSGVISIFEPLINSVFKAFENFAATGAGKQILTFITEFGRLLGNALTLIMNLLNGLINLMNIAIEYINTWFTTMGANEQQASAGAMATIIGVITLAISYFLDAAKEGKLLERMEVINELFEKGGKAIKSFTNMVNAVALKEIGKAVALIAVAMLLIAAIPQEKLGNTLKMVAGILVTFVGSLAIISSLSSKKVGASGLIGLIKSFQQLATGLLIMASVILKLMKVDPEELFMGLAAISSMLIILTGFVAMLTFIVQPSKGMDPKLYEHQISAITKILKASIVLGILINVLRSAMTSIGKMDQDDFIQGLWGLGAIMVAASVMIIEVSHIGKNAKNIDLFAKNISALTKALLLIAISMNLIMIPLTLMSVIPMKFMANGIVTMGFMVGYISILFKSLSKFSLNATEAQAKTVKGAAMVIMSLAVSMNLIFAPLMILSAMSAFNSEALEGGLWAFTRIIGLMVLFVGAMRVLASIGNKSVVNAGSKISIWVDTLEILARDMMLLAASVTAFMVPVVILGVLSQNGVIIKDVLLEFGGFLLSLFVFSSFTALLTLIPTVKTGITQIALAMFGVAGAFAMLGAALYAIVHVIKMLAENMEDPKFNTAAKKLAGTVTAAITVIGVVAGVSVAISKIADRKKTTIFGSGKQHDITDTTMTIGQEILALGTGLMMIAASLSTLMIPLRLILAFSDEEFDKAGWRMLKVVGALAGFIGIVMFAFGLMSKYGGNNATGWTQTISRTPTGLGNIFKSGQKRVSVNEATSFGANMKELGKALMLMAASLTILVIPMKLIGMLSPTEFDQGFTAVVTFLGLIAAIVTIFGYFYGKTWDSKKMTKFTFMLVVFTGVIAVICTILKQLAEYLKDSANREAMGHVTNTLFFIASIVAGLAILFGLIGKNTEKATKKEKAKPEKVQKTVGQLLGIAAIIGALGAAITAVILAINKTMATKWEDDWATKLVIIAGAILTLGGLFALVYGTAGKTLENSQRSIIVAGAVGIMALSLLTIAGAITMLSAIPSADSMGQMITKLAVMAALVAGIMVFIGIMSDKGQADAYAAAGFAIAFGIIAVAFLAIAGSMAILSKASVTMDQMFGFVVLVAVIFIALSAVADVTNGIDLIMTAAAFAIVSTGILALSAALSLMANVAKELPNGWDDMWEGVAVIGAMAAVGVILVAVITLITSKIQVVGLAMLVAAAIFGIVALSCLALAASIWLVVQTLIDLGGHWEDIEKGLNSVTDWLIENKETWTGILHTLFETVLADFNLTGLTFISTASDLGFKAAEAFGNGFKGIVNYAKKSWGEVGAERAKAKALEKQDNLSKRRALQAFNNSGYNLLGKNGLFIDQYGNNIYSVNSDTGKAWNAGGNKWFYGYDDSGYAEWEKLYGSSVYDAAVASFKNMINESPEYAYLTYDDLKEMLTGVYDPSGKWTEIEDRAKIWNNYSNKYIEAYLAAGGSLFRNGQWEKRTAATSQEEADKYKTKYGSSYSEYANQKMYEQAQELYGAGGIVTQANEAWLNTAEDVSTAAEAYGDGVELWVDPNLEASRKYGAKYGGVGKGSDYVNAQLAQSMAPGQAQAAQAGAEIYGSSFLDTLWSFFANNGDTTKTLWSEFGKTWAGQAITSMGEGFGKLGEDFNGFLKDNGIDIDWKKAGSDAIDNVAGYFGLDVNSESYKKFKEKASLESIKTTATNVMNDTIKGITVDKKDPLTALKDSLAFNNVMPDTFENSLIGQMVTEALGVKDLFGGEELDYEKMMEQFKIDGITDASKVVDDMMDKIFGGDAEEAASNYAAGVTSGLDTNLGNFNYQDILDKYNFNDGIYDYGYDMGADQALGQLDGYDQYMKDFDASKYTDQLSDYKTALGDYGSNSESNLIWRGYGRHGEELWAPSKEDMYNNLVKPIRDGFEWHGWDAEGAKPWVAIETAADAMKDAADQTALAEKKIITDENKQQWMLDENAGNWVAIDKNGNPITKTNMEGKEELWTKDIMKPDTKIQNGIWIWDAKNKQWIFSINGNQDALEDLTNGILMTDTKTGLNGTPTLSNEQYAAVQKTLDTNAERQAKIQAIQDAKYGDLDKKIKVFKDPNGKLYTDPEGKKYQSLRGRKMAGYDNGYVLVDSDGKLILDSSGKRIAFTADTVNGVKFFTESVHGAAEAFTNAGQEVETAAKSQTTQNGLYATSNAVSNAEATKDTYSIATVRNGDTGLVQSKYNNDVVPQNQANQQAQDATQSAKSAIDHLQEINSKMSELLPMVSTINTHVDGLDAGMYTLVSLVSDIGTKDSPVVLDSNKLVGALKGPLNAGLGAMARYGGRQVAT